MRLNFRHCLIVVAVLAGWISQAQSLPGPVFGRVNPDLPRWLALSGEERIRMEGLDGIGFQPVSNTDLLHRLRMNLSVTPLPWLKFVFQAQDSRVAFPATRPAPASQSDPLGLRIGYMQIGDSEVSPFSVRAGRQDLYFGDGRLVSDPNWSNVGKSFDGLRATLRVKKTTFHIFSGAFDKITNDSFDQPFPGEHFHGFYTSFGGLIPGAVVEPYLFWRLEHNVRGEVAKTGNLDTKTAGIRLAGKLAYGFDYNVEVVKQNGRQAGEPVSAWAGHWLLGKVLLNAPKRPRLTLEYNRASGDSNSRDGNHGAFDSLFGASHDRFGLADQFCWTNISHLRPGVQVKVRPSLTISAGYNSFWLASAHDGLYAGGKLAIASNGLQGTHIGQEADLSGQWNVSRYTLLEVGVGHIFPGEFLRRTGHEQPYEGFLLGIGQRF